MQRKEPSSGLVHALGNEVGRIDLAVVKGVLVLERIVYLGVRHRTRIKPYVDKVELALHRATRRRYENDVVDIRTVQVDFLIVFLGIVTRNEAFILQGIGGHHAGGYRFLNFIPESLHGVNDEFLGSIFGAPYGQRGAPIARAGQVPVLKVLKPFSETARAGCGRFPFDCLVQFHETLTGSSGTDEPAVEGIIEHRFVSAPAMGIIVRMLLGGEKFALLLEHEAYFHICGHVALGLGGVVGVLDKLAFPLLVRLNIHAVFDKLTVELIEHVETAAQVNHRHDFTGLVDEFHRGHAGLF